MGTGITHPTNTLTSIKECISLGADGSELDVQLTKDSVLIVFHDSNLKENTDKEGVINELNWSEIKGANYTNIPFLDYPVISLNELFEELSPIDSLTFSFDIKFFNGIEDLNLYRKRFVNALLRFIEKNNLSQSVFIESHDIELLKQLKTLKPSYRLLLYPSDFDSGLNLAKELDLYGVSISTDKITKEQIKKAHENGKFISLWSVNSNKKNKEAIRKNPDIIQTDRLQNLLNLLQ